MPRDSGETIFAARHQSVSQGPLGSYLWERGWHLEGRVTSGEVRGTSGKVQGASGEPLVRKDPCPSFPFFFWKKAQKTHQKTRIFYSYRTPEIPGKEGKHARKNKEFLAGEKTRTSKKTRKGRSEKTLNFGGGVSKAPCLMMGQCCLRALFCRTIYFHLKWV